MSRLPMRVRRLFAVGIPVLLLAVLTGCGQREADVARQEAAKAEEARAEAERAKKLANADVGPSGAIPSPLDIDKIDKATVDAAVTQDHTGQPNLTNSDPGLAVPGFAGVPGSLMSGEGVTP